MVATAKGEAAISEQTEASIDFYVQNAATDIRDVTAVKKGPNPKMFAYGSAVETQEALTRVETAKNLANKVT